MILRCITLFLAVFVLLNRADGRSFRSWNYEELLKASDLVAIIEPISSSDTKDIYPSHLYGRSPTDFTGYNTLFKVHVVFQGSFPTDKTLTVLHFSYSNSITMVANGARFARFIPGPLQFKKQILKDQKEIGGVTVYAESPVWLAFLKKKDDGRYEPVTDPYDSVDSFRELHQASFFIPFNE